jgi:hypothetical protein
MLIIPLFATGAPRCFTNSLKKKNPKNPLPCVATSVKAVTHFIYNYFYKIILYCKIKMLENFV